MREEVPFSSVKRYQTKYSESNIHFEREGLAWIVRCFSLDEMVEGVAHWDDASPFLKWVSSGERGSVPLYTHSAPKKKSYSSNVSSLCHLIPSFIRSIANISDPKKRQEKQERYNHLPRTWWCVGWKQEIGRYLASKLSPANTRSRLAKALQERDRKIGELFSPCDLRLTQVVKVLERQGKGRSSKELKVRRSKWGEGESHVHFEDEVVKAGSFRSRLSLHQVKGKAVSRSLQPIFQRLVLRRNWVEFTTLLTRRKQLCASYTHIEIERGRKTRKVQEERERESGME